MIEIYPTDNRDEMEPENWQHISGHNGNGESTVFNYDAAATGIKAEKLGEHKSLYAAYFFFVNIFCAAKICQVSSDILMKIDWTPKFIRNKW